MNELFEEIASDFRVDETTRRQKAQRALSGKLKNIKTICIMSAENPMGNQLSNEENKERRNALEVYLSNANYPWFRIKGKYGNDEKSHMVYNITLSEATKLGYKFDQESIIFIVIGNDGDTTYQYLEKSQDGKYEKTHERKEYLMMNDADDFYSSISRAFKFQIPFFDGSDDNESQINEQIKKINDKVESKYLSEERWTKYIENVTNEDKTEHCRYDSRGSLFAGWSI